MPRASSRTAKAREEKESADPGSIVDSVIADMRRGRSEDDAPIMTLGDDGLTIHIPGVIPTGSEWLDLAIGRGGWPLGRVSMLSGDEGSGKTSLALHACANTQRLGGVAVYVDAEYKLDRGYAKALGVNADRLIVSQPDSMEASFALIEEMAESFAHHRAAAHVPMLVVFDSLNAFVPQQELEGVVTPGASARAMSSGLKKLVRVLSVHKIALLMISQVRQKIGVMYGSNKSTAGGNAPRFYSTVIATLDPTVAVKEGDRKVGRVVKVEIGKNQVAAPFTRCNLTVRFGSGVDYVDSLHNALIAAGVADKGGKGDDEEKPRRRFGRRERSDEDADIDEKKERKKGGGWVTFTPPEGEPIRWQGPGGLRTLIADDREVFRTLIRAIRERYGWGDYP